MHPLIKEWVDQRGVHPNYANRQDERQRIIAEQQIQYSEQEMGRKPGGTNKKADPKVSALGEALAFVSVAATKDLQPYNSFVNLVNGFAVMCDGQITAGYPIEEQLTLVPNFDLLQKAIKKCGKTLSITELETNRLSIKGDKLRAIVPCITQEEFPQLAPDAPCAVIDDRLKHALACCGVLSNENGDRLIEASLLLEANQCTGTNGKVIMQFWHGIDLPPLLVIPKIFAAAVVKCQKPLTAFGWEPEKSITFFFEGGSWIKTLLYQDKWPEIQTIVEQPFYPSPVPDTFFEGVATVAEFNENDFVYVEEDVVKSHMSIEVGAQYEVPGAKGNKAFTAKYLSMIAPFVKQLDMTTYDDRAFFTGDNMRGLIIAAKVGE